MVVHYVAEAGRQKGGDNTPSELLDDGLVWSSLLIRSLLGDPNGRRRPRRHTLDRWEGGEDEGEGEGETEDEGDDGDDEDDSEYDEFGEENGGSEQERPAI